MKNILAINPGSTSTKIAVYRDETPVLVKSIPHSAEEVSKYAQVVDQLPMRKQLIFGENCSAAAGMFLKLLRFIRWSIICASLWSASY